MKVVTKAAQLPDSARPRAVVMTMGALHEGHASLLDIARAHGASVIATIFVNPTQFGPGEDFDRYPRTLEADLELCAAHDVDVVYTPSVADVYPNGPAATVDVGELGATLEGAARPGHFDGMATVVMRLLDLTDADVAVFGEKDAQQLAIVRQVAANQGRSVKIVAAPTVREADGLAMSSRNRYLDTAERAAAAAIPAALNAAAGEKSAESMINAARALLARQPLVRVEYLEIADEAFRPITRGEGRLLIAARVGQTRLIDNIKVELG